jgi:nitrite reductase (NO-forming)
MVTAGPIRLLLVDARTTIRTYQAAARLWLSAAVLALALPETWRLGIWLPLHLALAGAVSVAIAGAMQNFALTLTAAPSPAAWVVLAQFAGVNVGALLVAVGYPSRHPALVAWGGAVFVAAALVLGGLVVRAWRIGLNRRHALPLALYLLAVTAVVAGGVLGALVGSGAVGGALWGRLRSAHLIVNVLGWVSLTIAATLITLLPTVLRVRMPAWQGVAAAGALAAGPAATATGLAVSSMPLATAGGLASAAGALGLGWMVVKVLRTPRRWPVPVAGKHLICALGWFLVGSFLLPSVLAGGAGSLARFREPYLAIFVGGWALQTLLGAWQYLLPMSRPGHPDDRRRQLAAIELGGTLQVVALNSGLVLLAISGTGWVPGSIGAVGAGLALGAGILALAKAWAFGPLSRAPVLSSRQLDVWGA